MGKDRYDRVNYSFFINLKTRLKFAKILFVNLVISCIYSYIQRIRVGNLRGRWCMQFVIFKEKSVRFVLSERCVGTMAGKFVTCAGYLRYGDAVVITLLYQLLHGYTEVK